MKQFEAEVLRERDLVRKDLQRANRVNGEQAEVILSQEQQIKQLETEIRQQTEAVHKQRQLLAKVEKERDKHIEEAQVLSDKLEVSQGMRPNFGTANG